MKVKVAVHHDYELEIDDKFMDCATMDKWPEGLGSELEETVYRKLGLTDGEVVGVYTEDNDALFEI